jgi:hypothetical protein
MRLVGANDVESIAESIVEYQGAVTRDRARNPKPQSLHVKSVTYDADRTRGTGDFCPCDRSCSILGTGGK